MKMYASQETGCQQDTLQQLIAQFRIMHGSAADHKLPATAGLSSEGDTGYTYSKYDSLLEDWHTRKTKE